MDNSNRNRTPAELEQIEARLRAERHEASPLELDRIKLQAIHQVQRSRPSLYALKKGSFMKSRLALTLGPRCGLHAEHDGRDAGDQRQLRQWQRLAEPVLHPRASAEPRQRRHASGGEDKCKNGNGGGGNGAGDKCDENGTQPVTAVEVAPAVEQQAVVSSDSSLPFTGFVAIPLLIIGLALIVVGALIRLKSRNEPIIRS